ncbi:MAG TPA: radical SAM protein [Deltaproteobacteria bacterium]|nr:radical SAM protein [Deltaproteobacteria bacterium]HOI07451.1 radical SAM protein [Deltaproteobacteria bacterium]
MKIALIAPPYPLEEAPSPPLGLAYVAAACEAAGATVRIFDYIVSRYTPEKLRSVIEDFGADAVGTTSVTMNFPQAARIIRDAKRIKPSLVTMMGGPHVSFDIENTFRDYPELDLIVKGEGEATLSELVPVLLQRDEWRTVNGIAFVEDGKVHVTPPRPLIEDLDSLPRPARHLLPISRYLALGFPVSLITSRGCPNKCIFCLGRKMVGYKARFRSPRLVVDEIEEILGYGFTRINIADDLFTANKERVKALCAEIKARGVKFDWSAFARVNTVDREILAIMKDAGCDSISFGIESGNPEMLKRIRKGITLDQAREATKICKEAGMITHASFMVGLPGETLQTMRDTGAFAEELDIVYGYHFLAPFPGTTVREELNKYDLEILTDDWSRYDANSPVVCTSGASPDQMTKFVKDYEAVLDEEWQEVMERYGRKECTPHEDLLVEGNRRMKLIYRLLSEDVIEACTVDGRPAEIVKAVSRRIAEKLGEDYPFVSWTVQTLVDKGCLKASSLNGTSSLFWTHNLKLDRLDAQP